MSPKCRVGMVACALMVGGCASTGDPRQGGLFGWSEEQAKARQAYLKQDEMKAQDQAESEQRRTAMLSGRQTALATEASRLESEVNRLLDENGKLDAQLRDLMQRRQLGQDDAQRLRKVLADNAKLRIAAPPPEQERIQPNSQARAESLNTQNNRLHREIMILLQR